MISHYDAFEHLCSSAFADDAQGGVLAYLTVYSDASYNQPSASDAAPRLLHTVGAYIATRDNWRRFRKEWKRELEKKGLEYFHMTDFEYAQNAIRSGKLLKASDPYYGWQADEFVPFLKRLHGVINRKNRDGQFRMRAFIASIVRPDFDKTLPAELQDEPGCKSHYIFNVVMIMDQIAQWADSEGCHDPIHYVFAGGDGEGANLENWFNYCWGSEVLRKRFRLSKGYSRIGYDIEWMKAEPALQAADIAAYECNKLALKGAARGNFKIDENELRKSLVNLCRATHRGRLLRETEFHTAFSHMVAVKKRHGAGFVR